MVLRFIVSLSPCAGAIESTLAAVRGYASASRVERATLGLRFEAWSRSSCSHAAGKLAPWELQEATHGWAS